MEWIRWHWPSSKQGLRAGVLAIIALTAVHNAVFVPLLRMRGIASSHATALAAMEEPATLAERSPLGLIEDAQISTSYLSASFSDESSSDGFSQQLHKGDSLRLVAHTADFSITVPRPAEATEKIRALAEQLGGHLVASQYSGSDSNYASISISVPATTLDQAKAGIRKLAIRVESESTETEDVTKQWVDSEARLRNLRATEQQYLQILKLARSVQDTLDVSGKLGEVRGQIEQFQTEFAALAKRVQMVAISVRLSADADVQVLGLRWRPLYRAKLSLREAVDAMGSYGATMFSVVLHIPVIALWLLTFFTIAAIGWKVLRWAARIFFGWKLGTSS